MITEGCVFWFVCVTVNKQECTVCSDSTVIEKTSNFSLEGVLNE